MQQNQLNIFQEIDKNYYDALNTLKHQQHQNQSIQQQLMQQQQQLTMQQLQFYQSNNRKNEAKQNLRNRFTKEEDSLLKNLVDEHTNEVGKIDWNAVSSKITGRTNRQCRERYTNYLKAHQKKSKWSKEEDELLIEKYNEYGPKWILIEQFFHGRSNINIKNHFSCLLRALSRQSLKKTYSQNSSDVSDEDFSFSEDSDEYESCNDKSKESPDMKGWNIPKGTWISESNNSSQSSSSSLESENESDETKIQMKVFNDLFDKVVDSIFTDEDAAIFNTFPFEI
ncbi:Myb-like DNA-binding domain containing protein [Tritrichomonas foetus]|uniref:Myb-like DNA-binding domain containing protein n=1 Tax=Tritrichomonas foetus TaxID=1144522 RepID=A0A1J4KUX2_9EUKA|nr:Myb-like DNA-binding domain containing protein [Tritrichomonas foetus]|eukprot:OHT14672.1 Myb-like DNA-binding domain containing protein [Tritrichomonas foetus]